MTGVYVADASESSRTRLTRARILKAARQEPGRGPQGLRAERVDELLAPARDMAAAVIARGKWQGVLRAGVPPGPPSRALEGVLVGLLECVNAGTWADDGTRTAIAALVAVGGGDGLAVTCVRRLGRSEGIGA